MKVVTRYSLKIKGVKQHIEGARKYAIKSLFLGPPLKAKILHEFMQPVYKLHNEFSSLAILQASRKSPCCAVQPWTGPQNHASMVVFKGNFAC